MHKNGYAFDEELEAIYQANDITRLSFLNRIAQIILLAQGYDLSGIREMLSRAVEDSMRAWKKMFDGGKKMKYRSSTVSLDQLNMRMYCC